MKKMTTIILLGLSLQIAQADTEGVSVYGFCVKKIAAMMAPENHNVSLTTTNKKAMSALIKNTRRSENLGKKTRLAARAYYWGDFLTGVVVYDYPDCHDDDGECSAYRTEYFYEIFDINDSLSKPILRFNHLGTYYGDDQGPEMRYNCANTVKKIKL